MKKKVVKKETKTRKPEKDAHLKETGSKRRKTEINRTQHEITARSRKSSVEPVAAGELMVFCQSETIFFFWHRFERILLSLSSLFAGPQRRSGRLTRQNRK